MKPFSALCFSLTGLALWLRREPPAAARRRPRWHLLLATTCAAIVLLVGGAMLLEHLLPRYLGNLGLDGLLFHDALVDANAVNLGRMSLATSLCMACFGLALLLLDGELASGQRPAQYLVLGVLLVGLLGFEGNLFGPDAVFATFPFAAMPWPAAVLFVMLGLAVLHTRPDRGLMAAVTSEHVGGLMARRVLPVAILLPLLIALPRLQGERLGWYPAEAGLTIFATLTITIFTASIWLSARSLNQIDAERGRAESATARALADLVEANRRLQGEVAERERAEAELRDSNLRLESTLVELRVAQQQIIEQERLGALGQLASGIAHDFNNTLGPILGYSDLLIANPEQLADIETTTEYLQAINSAAQSAASVVSRLRDFYRRRTNGDAHGPIRLPDVIAQAISITRPRWKDQVQVTGAVINVRAEVEDLSPIDGNPAELRDALVNLILNAVDALPAGGTIVVRARAEQDQRGQPGVLLEVADNGTGMTDEVRRRCLEPFFTTKGDQGTGLGLSIVHGMLRRQGGTLEIESAVGQGTAMRFRFAARRTAEAASGSQQPAPPARRSLRVLMVDDEPMMREVIARFLRLDDHVVALAGSGREALAQLQAGPPFDLVITDRAMPEMGGDELASIVKVLSPGTPVLMLTGFADLMGGPDERPEDVDMVIGKPTTLARLRVAVAALVGESTPVYDLNAQ
jgi:signal transduction histidine kinase